MNFTKVWIITKSLLLSQLRATATSRRGSIRSIIRRPRVLGMLDVAAFVLATGAMFYISSLIVGTPIASTVAEYTKSGLVILPAIIMSMILLIGLIFEITSSYQFSSSDTANWLPVTASEYVLASALALVIYYSILPIVLIGGLMPLAYTFGLMQAWEYAVVLSIFGIFLGASVLEIIRAVLNRFSSSFYKKGGQAAIAIRAITGVLILVVFQLMFYPTIYTRFIGAVTSSFGPIWFVPILWASVSVAAFIDGSALVSVSFAMLSIALTLLLYYIAVVARTKYWVPMPPSIRISSAVYTPKSSPSFLGFLSATQLAIARKDLRGLVRRKEMLRFLALPGVFLATSIFSLSSSGGMSFFTYFGVFVVGISSFFLATSSVGSEGKAITNLYQAPVATKDFLIGKVTTPSIFGSLIGILFFIVIGALFESTHLAEVVVFLAISLVLSVELSLVGLYIGARFPNFSEAPRSSYMSQTAALIAFPIGAILIGITLAPLFVAALMATGLEGTFLAFVGSVAVAVILSGIFYALASGQVRRLLSQLPF